MPHRVCCLLYGQQLYMLYLTYKYTCICAYLNDGTRFDNLVGHGLLVRYVKLRVAHAPGMPGTISPQPRVSDPDMHQGTCVMHVPWYMSGSLTSLLLRSRWRENVPGISGACAIHNFTYLVRGPWVNYTILESNVPHIKGRHNILPYWGPVLFNINCIWYQYGIAGDDQRFLLN